MIPEQFEYGVAWYPEWDTDAWRAELDAIVAAGFNTVRIAEFAWDRIERSAGKFDFSLFDDVMAECERREVRVVLGVDTVRPPEWVFELHPDIHLVDQFGHQTQLRWPRHCSNHPAFAELSARLIEQLIPRYRSSSALRYYQIDNEPALQDHNIGNDRWLCYCAHCRAQFSDWLDKRYAGRTRPAIAVPFPTQPEMGELAWLEWRAFHDESVLRRVTWVRDRVRALDPDHPITTNVMVSSGFGEKTSALAHDVYRLIGSLDIVGMDYYPDMSVAAREMDTMVYSISDQLANGEGFFCLETQATPYSIGPGGGWHGQEAGLVDYGPPKRVEPQFWNAIAHGGNSLLYWVWRLRNENVWAVARPDGSLEPAAAVAKKLSDEIKSVWPRIAGSQRPDARIAVVFNRASEHLAHLAGVRGGSNPNAAALVGKNGAEVLNAFSAARRYGASVDVVDLAVPGASLDAYDAVIGPFLFVVSTAEAELLNRFVTDGGTLIWGARGGERGEPAGGWFEIDAGARMVIPTDVGLPQPLQSLLGFMPRGSRLVEGITINADASAADGPSSGGGWCRTVELTGDTEVVSVASNGMPGVLRSSTGAGQTFTILADVFQQFDAGLTALVGSLLRRAGTSATADVLWSEAGHEIVRRHTAEGELVFVINFTSERWDAEFAAGWSSATDLLAGESAVSTDGALVRADVPAYGTRIFTCS